MKSRLPFLIACFALEAFMMAATPGYAACWDGDGNKIPCLDDPSGGGSGGGGDTVCYAVGCAQCGVTSNPNGTSWEVCLNVTWSSSCLCDWPGGWCAGYGNCTCTG